MVQSDTMMGSSIVKKRRRNLYSNPIFWIMALAIELTFLRIGSQNIILSMVVLILLTYFYVVKQEKIFVSVVLLFSNDALGMILNIVAVKYLVLAFIVYEIVIDNTKIRIKSIPLGLFMIYMIAQPFITGLDNLNGLLSTLLPFLHLVILFGKNKDKNDFIQTFAEATTIIVTLLALHACLTGGYSMYDDAVITGYIRKGILGVGDANFSSLILCTGIACTINCKHFTKLIKAIIIVVMIGAIANTVSVAGFLSVCMVFVLSVLLNNKVDKKIRNVLFGILAIIVLVWLYTLLPKTMHFASIDSYVDRILVKYNSFLIGDFSELTTGRSDISDNYLGFISSQNMFSLIFGGNHLLQFQHVPHNTYIDLIVQFGVVGLLIFILVSLTRLGRVVFSCERTEYRKLLIILKLLYLMFIASISVYHGVSFVLLLFILLIL